MCPMHPNLHMTYLFSSPTKVRSLWILVGGIDRGVTVVGKQALCLLFASRAIMI